MTKSELARVCTYFPARISVLASKMGHIVMLISHNISFDILLWLYFFLPISEARAEIRAGKKVPTWANSALENMPTNFILC